VAIALALDPRERYENAREMGRAINDGALGISPAEHRVSSHRDAAPATEATSVLASATRVHGGSSARGGAVAPRRPRRGPARTPAPVAASAAPRRASGARRLTTLLIALLALGGAIAAIVVLSAPAPTKIVLRNVVYEDAQESAEALKQLVNENTK